MAKFQTNVAGVTHYNVDFSSIRKSSPVRIVPEPDCPYDDCALRVIINGNHVGYIKKGFNRTIWKEIKRGSKVSARVKAVVGGGAGKNHGIVLNLVVDDGYAYGRSGDDLGSVARSKSTGIKVVRSNLPSIPTPSNGDLWMEFLEQKKNLPRTVELPKEPDYRAGYDEDVPWLTRLWGESFESYRTRRRNEWLESCAEPKRHNEERNRQLGEFNAKRHLLSSEFNAHVYESKLRRLLQVVRANVSSDEAKCSSQYTTVYEHSIYDALKPKIRNTFHQVIIDARSIDILCIPDDMSAVWAIEIDGGIHRRKVKIDRDFATEQRLSELGVSLIRVPNYMVSKSPEVCSSKILEVIGIEQDGGGNA